MNNLESKYLGEKLVRHSSLESLERPKCEVPITPKPKKKEIELSDHIQFLITEKSPPQACLIDVRDAIDDGDVLSEGKHFPCSSYHFVFVFFLCCCFDIFTKDGISQSYVVKVLIHYFISELFDHPFQSAVESFSFSFYFTIFGSKIDFSNENVFISVVDCQSTIS